MNYYQQNQTAFLDGLKAFLRIPSISALSENKPDIRRAAEFVRAELLQAGMTSAELIEGDGNPLVYAEWTGAPGKPTLLMYGHYDVQPPDPLEEWKSPPFDPVVRGNDIFGRGTSDDKGQTYILIKAVEGLLKTTGRLPVNVKFLIEGEEETGGEHIERYVASKPARLAADAAVICDTEMFAPELPSICVGLRGIVYGEIQVEGANHDLHSGVYGGAAPNPLQAVAEIICALKDREGRILIPGFYDRITQPTAKEREAWARLPFNEAEYTEKEMGARALVGEPDKPLFERLWARPTFEVHGIKGGFIGEGAKTVIPARATAKVSTRLVADQRRRPIAGESRQPVHRSRGRRHAAGVRRQDGLLPLRRLHSHCWFLRSRSGNPLGHDGLRPAGRQPARAQRKAAPAEFLPWHRGGCPLPGNPWRVGRRARVDIIESDTQGGRKREIFPGHRQPG
jgi:acetylornithine deacetylase/succinyl-diaminopimelate desuccinylase-like protein